MAIKRRLKIRQNATKRERVNNGRRVAGGIRYGTTGYTSDLSNLTVVKKNIYGLFNNRSTYELDVLEGFDRPVIEPLFDYKSLIKILLQNSILRQCVQAYVTNIEGYGHTLEYVGPEGQQDSLAARNEKRRLDRVLQNLTTDHRTLQQHREHARVDFEVLGARAFEISRDLVGRTIVFNHVHTCTLRMTKREKEATPVEMINPVTGQSSLRMRRFRRFLQINEDNKKIWFKEYGDPRPVSPITGKVDNSLPVEDQATEIYYEGHYTPGTPYGTPRWAGAIPAMLGGREAEMVNLNFFRDNAIPAMAVLVSGGALTSESFDTIEQYIAGIRGQKSMNRIVVLEATAEANEAASIDGSIPAPKVDLKPMLSERQHEGLFGNYINEGEDKVRSSFRLPPVYIGDAEEYNRASAIASIQVADTQVFIPERSSWDFMFHNIVLASHNPKYYRYKSNAPTQSDTTEVSRLVNTLSKEGGLTPNIAIKLANRYLDADIQPVLDEWGDYPFQMVMQSLKSGAQIKGLDDFIEKMDDVGNSPLEPDNDNTQDASDQAARYIRNGIRNMMDDLADTLKNDIETIVQLNLADA